PSGKPIKYLKGIETERGFEEVGEEEIIKGGDQCRKFVFDEQLLTRRKGSRRGSEYDHRYGLQPYGRYYGYPRLGCTFAIREYQRRWPYHLWPPSMRCFPYPN